jgi:hypothetical protein
VRWCLERTGARPWRWRPCGGVPHVVERCLRRPAEAERQPRRCGLGEGVGKAGWSGRLVRTLLSGWDLPRAGDATNRAAQRGRRSGTRVESCRSASKGARRRQPVGAANGRCGRRLAGALLDWDSRRRRERTSRGAAPDWGRMTSATDGRGPVVRERERAPRGRGCYGLGQVSGLIW